MVASKAVIWPHTAFADATHGEGLASTMCQIDPRLLFKTNADIANIDAKPFHIGAVEQTVV